MKPAKPYAILLAAAVTVFAGMHRAGAETLYIHEFAGVFDEVAIPGDGTTFQLLGGTITHTAPDTLPEQLTIGNVTVDLSGYDDLDGGSVTVLGNQLTVSNPLSGTSAQLAVDSATLTQVLNDPIGVGYVMLDLSTSASDLQTLGGDTINLQVFQSVVSINGLVITTDGSNGTATLDTLASASISAVPEPSALLLALLAAVSWCGYRRLTRAGHSG
jgi:hypothetical protein